MQSIFEYLDYRKVLLDAFEERKSHQPRYSYSMLAESLGLDTSYVYRILHQRSHLPARCQSRALEFLGLSGRPAEYFMVLVAYSRERNAKDRQVILESAMSLRDVERRILQDAELAYFGSWWIGAIRSMIEVLGGNADAAEIARRLQPPVPVDKVTDAIKLLIEIGLVKKVSSGYLAPTSMHVSSGTTPAKIEAIRKYQRDILGLATESIERFPRELRDISTITLSVDDEGYQDMMGLLRDCRRRVQKRAEEISKPNRVVQMAVAIFPLSDIPKAAG